jgi:hypothetical protein
VFNEQISKLKDVLKEYHKKFMGEKEEKKVVMNPREMLPEIIRLMSQEICRNRY